MSNKEKRFFTDEEIKIITKDLDKSNKIDVFNILKKLLIYKSVTKKDITEIKRNIKNKLKDPYLPRLLTEEEIQYIVDVIPVGPCAIKEVGESICSQIKNSMKMFLRGHKFSIKEKTLETIRNQIYEKYIKSTVEAGDSVGSFGSMAIGEPLTQENLNTFHTAGAEHGTEGSITAITNLFNSGPNNLSNRSCVVHFKNKNMTKEEIKVISSAFQGISIQDVVFLTESQNELPEKDKVWYLNFFKIINPDFSFKDIKNKKFLRVCLNTYKCFTFNITIEEIVQILKNNTRNNLVQNTIYCVFSPDNEGIIDIYADDEFINLTVDQFSKKGETFAGCEHKKYRDSVDLIKEDKHAVKRYDNVEKEIKRKENENERILKNEEIKKRHYNKKKEYIHTPINSLIGMDDMSLIFLNVILKECLGSMMIRGNKGITNVFIPKPKSLLETFNDFKITSYILIEKYTQKPYNIKLEEVDLLWGIRVKKTSIILDGLNMEKYVSLFKEAGLEIIDITGEYKNVVIVKIPKERTDMFFQNKKAKKLYSKNADGKYINNKSPEENASVYGPTKIIRNKVSFSEEKMLLEINKKITKPTDNFVFENVIYPEIYRLCYYCYAIMEGKDIISKILANKIVDTRFTHPNGVPEVYELYGIEAARTFLLTKYRQTIQKDPNPVHITLLVDVQTYTGRVSAVNSMDVKKQGKGTLSNSSFEKPMEDFKSAAAFGTVDEIAGVSGSIVSGKKCKNGTGIVKLSYSEDYLNDNNNKILVNIDEFLDDSNDAIIGSCETTSSDNLEIINEDQEDEVLIQGGNDLYSGVKKPELAPKTSIPTPPRIIAPAIIPNIPSDSTFKKVELSTDEVPDDPGEYEEEDDDYGLGF